MTDQYVGSGETQRAISHVENAARNLVEKIDRFVQEYGLKILTGDPIPPVGASSDLASLVYSAKYLKESLEGLGEALPSNASEGEVSKVITPHQA